MEKKKTNQKMGSDHNAKKHKTYKYSFIETSAVCMEDPVNDPER